MPTYHRATWIDAPLDEVWEFHSRIAGLTELTPGVANLEIGTVTGPDGETDPEILAEGARIEMSLRPLDVGPRQSWTSVITDREAELDNGRAYFRDVMEDGPFPEWEHTHRFFESEAGETLVDDRVVYRLPGGPLGRVAEPFGGLGFEPMFYHRHRATKAHFE
ncbi:MAG: SRPBCC family protein [Halobacteriales archaeon]|nr:SRPBCC family protein [Halobacteriales archaeon]